MGGINLVPGQPQAAGEPVFDAPWQARAFAMAVHMNERGLFEWQEWADRLSSRIAQYELVEDIEGSDAYYRLWLDTLESFAQELSSSRQNSHE